MQTSAGNQTRNNKTAVFEKINVCKGNVCSFSHDGIQNGNKHLYSMHDRPSKKDLQPDLNGKQSKIKKIEVWLFSWEIFILGGKILGGNFRGFFSDVKLTRDSSYSVTREEPI